MNDFSSTNKMLAFKNFLLQRNPSEKFAHKTITYLSAKIIRETALNVANVDSIDKVPSLDSLFKIYGIVKVHPNNIRLHNVYSGSISAYIKFITGKELRKRVYKKDEISA